MAAVDPGGVMPAVERVHPVPRRIANAVGAGYVVGAEARPRDPIPVVVQVSWDGAPPERVPGLCVAWTRGHVRVRVRDATTSLSYARWFVPSDVTRAP